MNRTIGLAVKNIRTLYSEKTEYKSATPLRLIFLLLPNPTSQAKQMKNSDWQLYLLVWNVVNDKKREK